MNSIFPVLPFFLSDSYCFGMSKEEYEKYQKTDRYLDKPFKIPPVLLFLAFNYRNYNYWWY